MVSLLILAASFGWLSFVADPCNPPHRAELLGNCHVLMPAPASRQSTPLDHYKRQEFGLLQVERLHDHRAARLTPAELGELLPVFPAREPE